MTESQRDQFLDNFCDGDWHELKDIGIRIERSPELVLQLAQAKGIEHLHEPERFPELVLQLAQKEGITIRGDVTIDIGRPGRRKGWKERLVSVPGIPGNREASHWIEELRDFVAPMTADALMAALARLPEHARAAALKDQCIILTNRPEVTERAFL
jgi:hypothetical protein